MPFFRNQRIFEDCYLGLWKIEEDLSYFEDKLQLYPPEKEHVLGLSKRKKIEWYASRWTLHLLSGREDRGACLYDTFGKPYLENSSLEISMSHSKDFVAVMAGKDSIGIDIQVIVPKILRIQSKFLTREELAFVDNEHSEAQLHVLWGAKECLFKGYGKGQLAFKEKIKIAAFQYNDAGGKLTGTVEKDDYFCTFDIEYSPINNYMLVYAKAINHKK